MITNDNILSVISVCRSDNVLGVISVCRSDNVLGVISVCRNDNVHGVISVCRSDNTPTNTDNTEEMSLLQTLITPWTLSFQKNH
jgi:hypothetical protein